MSEKQSVFKENLWKTFREPRELLFKTTLKILQESLASWQQKMEKWGVTQEFY